MKGHAKDKGKGSAASLRPSNHFVPYPTELCRPILIVLARESLATQTLAKAVARQVDFPSKAITTKYPTEEGNSFKKSFDQALRHLRRENMVLQFGNTWSIGAEIRDKARRVSIPPFSLETNATREHAGWPMNVKQFYDEIATVSVDRLTSMLDSAQKVAANYKTLGELGTAVAVIENIRAEVERRVHQLGNDEYFRWPSTATFGGDGSLVMPDVPEVSPLKQLGYTVGRNGTCSASRQQVLIKAFLEVLPQVAGVEAWGEPNTGVRLKKIAHNLAAMTKMAKRRRSGDHRDAINMREADLTFLHDKFYVGRYDREWSWPTTNV
ncbi:hypothetical protein GHK50_16900 [Sinorhizobium medicae]|uniref:Uncharacterized protein n=1 Tax=Sinorhizobium medicae TaxID=110321 RepID=A0A6G1WPC0_9HYPH|nr:hypothetical protein [Sinorhizobium medicae]MQW71574.1 hypothetical protein [Sinorhizobium medicae]MQX84770.1 hypothetical protein [Sinorhizobium medicae]